MPYAVWDDEKKDFVLCDRSAAMKAGAEEVAEIERLRTVQERAEQVLIAYGMGWDLDGVMHELKKVLPRPQ